MRKLTAEEIEISSQEYSKPLPAKQKNTIEVQCRYLRKLPEGSIFDFMKSMREWHRHALYKSVKDAEKAVETLNTKDGLQIGASPKKRVYEYRIKPNEK